MANIFTALKLEISRLARKEVRSEIDALKRASSAHRTDIARLKREVHSLEQQLRRLSKAGAREAATLQVGDDAKHRFSAKGFATLRTKLGLSAAEMGLLVGASDQSIYKWERGDVRPRASQLPAIAQVRGIGKREAMRRLETVRKAA